MLIALLGWGGENVSIVYLCVCNALTALTFTPYVQHTQTRQSSAASDLKSRTHALTHIFSLAHTLTPIHSCLKVRDVSARCGSFLFHSEARPWGPQPPERLLKTVHVLKYSCLIFSQLPQDPAVFQHSISQTPISRAGNFNQPDNATPQIQMMF